MGIINLFIIFSERILFNISWNNGQSRLPDCLCTVSSGWSSIFVDFPSSVNATKNKKKRISGEYYQLCKIFLEKSLFNVSWINDQRRLPDDWLCTGSSGWSTNLVDGSSAVNAHKNKKNIYPMSIIKLCITFSETSLFNISWNNGKSRLQDLVCTGCSGWSSNLVGGPSSVNATWNKKNIRWVLSNYVWHFLKHPSSILAEIMVKVGYLIGSALVHQVDNPTS